jgi:hypothetical protein
MKFSSYPLILIIISLLIVSCNSSHNPGRVGSPIEIDTAVLFRKNYFRYVETGDTNYHIPTAFMFELEEFAALLNMKKVNKIRFYPAINTHHDEDPDSLTLIMVPVSTGSGKDDFSACIYEFCQICPPTCSNSGVYPCPTASDSSLKMPMSWCLTTSVISDIIKVAESIVGAGNVYGIRIYQIPNDKNEMDFRLVATTEDPATGYIKDIETFIPIQGVTEMCWAGDGCCDIESILYRPAPLHK